MSRGRTTSKNQFGKIPARDFPLNRCYTFFLQEKKPKAQFKKDYFLELSHLPIAMIYLV